MLETGNTKKIEGKEYVEFRKNLPSPHHFRYYYFLKKGDSIDPENYFTDLRYQPQVIQNGINQIMINKLNSVLKNK